MSNAGALAATIRASSSSVRSAALPVWTTCSTRSPYLRGASFDISHLRVSTRRRARCTAALSFGATGSSASSIIGYAKGISATSSRAILQAQARHHVLYGLVVPGTTTRSSDTHLGQLGGDRARGVTKPPLPNQPPPVARERLATTPADSVSKHLRRSPMYIWVLLAPCSHFSADATVPGKHAAMTRPGWGQQLQLDGEP